MGGGAAGHLVRGRGVPEHRLVQRVSVGGRGGSFHRALVLVEMVTSPACE